MHINSDHVDIFLCGPSNNHNVDMIYPVRDTPRLLCLASLFSRSVSFLFHSLPPDPVREGSQDKNLAMGDENESKTVVLVETFVAPREKH